jgi:serine protease Do
MAGTNMGSKLLFLAFLAAFSLGAELPGQDPARVERLQQGVDFREVIAEAKSRVFPALIYVAPVVEAFTGGEREKREQGGSGVVITDDGYAVTNWHVIEKALSIRVLLHDGRFSTAKKIGEDRETDIGLLKIDPLPGLDRFPHAGLADSSKLREGEFVLAMGAPWGLSRSVSLGIISATTRYLPGNSEYSLWIQTDASINPGNSGGPLVNTDGEVIGINTLGNLIGGDMGFAVPANTVREITRHLREHGRVIRAWTGIRLQPLRDFDRNIFFEGNEGALVASVDKDSPGRAAGLKVGDLILQIGDHKVRGLHYEEIPAIHQILGDLPIDKEVPVRVRRGSEELALQLTPRDKGSVEGQDLELASWNMTVKTINEFETPTLHFFVKKGVYVQGVRSPGNAAKAGLRRGDIIRKVDAAAVETIGDIERIYKGVVGEPKKEKKVLFEVLRGGLTYQIVLDYSTKYGDK